MVRSFVMSCVSLKGELGFSPVKAVSCSDVTEWKKFEM